MLDKGCTTIKGALNELDGAPAAGTQTGGLFCRQPSVCESATYASGTVFQAAN